MGAPADEALNDTGTITATINGVPASYTWGTSDTWATVQQGLISAIMNAKWTPTTTGGQYLTASAASNGILLTSLTAGSNQNWLVGVTVTESDNDPPFTASAANMVGGTAAEGGATAASNYTTLVYTPGGSKLATYTNGVLQSAEIPLPGGGTAMYNASGLNYLRHPDWLGSSRLATTWSHNVYSKTAYAPFGETYNTSGTDASFTGEDVDPNSSYYNFLYRKFDPVAEPAEGQARP